MKKQIKIIDLFAGPGGLGEGFSAYSNESGDHPFKIGLSIEKESSAHRTLKLRAFYRQFPKGKAPKAYYDFLAGRLGKDPEALYQDPRYKKEAYNAAVEAQQLTLGENNQAINTAIRDALGNTTKSWVLIGGPPCQAYSLAGRSRNKGIEGYKAENDHRNFLYKEYLRVIARFRPAVFVMENVKGLLSANVGGVRIFNEIMNDLVCPARALKTGDHRQDYEIFSLTTPSSVDENGNMLTLTPKEFIIRAEQYSTPQARHRVILLGIRKDIAAKFTPQTLTKRKAPSVKDIIGDLPMLRSGLSKREDTFVNWSEAIKAGSDAIIRDVKKHRLHAVAEAMEDSVRQIGNKKLDRGNNWRVEHTQKMSSKLDNSLIEWYRDPSGWSGICNHETRGHIVSDLHRYLFCACYSQSAKNEDRLTPKAEEFPTSLAPDHANWDSGHFADRFRVQAASRYATTITSHISKDGHYFIHYDPKQCRSLTVREAARIQTFPDNYFFVGNRTQQYVQVGNAVPPYLANQIAEIVYNTMINS